MSKSRVVIAGQIPPPYGGQNIMIQKAVAQFAALPEYESVHLPFFFTADFQQARKVGLGKLLELLRVIGRLLRIRSAGPIDLLIYPSGGPQTIPVVRDILLLPWMLICSRKVILHFHAAGITDRFEGQRRGVLFHLLSALYRRISAAVVMTEFNRRDPAFFGIREIIVRPHKIPDEFDATLDRKRDANDDARLLYVGHLHPDKGTDELLRAFGALRKDHPRLTLELVGECLPPWTVREVEALIEDLGVRTHVTLSGVLRSQAKAAAFARADLFVFPTVAPYESFGLVLIEAMMWRLPIIASRWRGNADVLTPAVGGVTFEVSRSLAQDIREAIEGALSRKNDWSRWGEENRSIFETRYLERAGDLWLAEAVVSQIDG